MSDCNCPLSLGPDCPHCANDRSIRIETRAIPPDIQAGIEDAARIVRIYRMDVRQAKTELLRAERKTAQLEAEVATLRAEAKGDPIVRLHRLCDELSVCDDCEQPACDDAKPEGPHVLCHDCAIQHKALRADLTAARAV